MNSELADTLQLIIDRYGNRTEGSVFIPMKAHNEGHLTKLCEEGLITKPRYFDNGAEITLTRKGRNFFLEKQWVIFPAVRSSITCPVCGYKAEVINTDATRSWAEIQCENCSTYAMKADALASTPSFELFLLAGYYRHVRRNNTVQCDSQETVKEHIEEARKVVVYQTRLLLRHYYQKMTRFGEYVELERLPALAYAKDEDDLMNIIAEAVENGYADIEDALITVTRQGKEYLDMEQQVKRTKIFISHRSVDKVSAEAIVDFLQDLGVQASSIVCTSVPDTLIPNGEKIYDWLREQFNNYSLHVIFLLSKAYYESPDCLNEMGAAWVTKTKSDVILLPGFSPSDIRGCIGSDTIAIHWDGQNDILEDRLTQLRDSICAEFGLDIPTERRWVKTRETVIGTVRRSSRESETEDHIQTTKMK